MGMIENAFVFLLFNPLILVIIALLVAALLAFYSNRDNLLSNNQIFVTFLLYLSTLMIIEFGFLVLLGITLYSQIQAPLSNMFTSVGFVLSIFAVALSIGYSAENTITTLRLQRDITTQIENSLNIQRDAIQTEIGNVSQQLQIQIQNQNHHIEEIIENNNHQLLVLIQNQNHHIEGIIENNNYQLQIHLQNHHIEAIIEDNNHQLQALIQNQNHHIEEIIEKNNHQLQALIQNHNH